MLASQSVLTLNKRGRDEEIMGKERRRLPVLALSDGLIVCKKKLVKKTTAGKTCKTEKAKCASCRAETKGEVS